MLPLLIYVLILNWPLAQALAFESREADLVPIGTVLADPQHYNLKSVRFHGTITGITVLHSQGGCRDIDAYLFQLEDGTGNITVWDEGFCPAHSIPPMLVQTSTKMGDRISVTAIVLAPSHAPEIPIRAQLQRIGPNTNFDPPKGNPTTCRTFEECTEKQGYSPK
jgi:hypothetical protein